MTHTLAYMTNKPWVEWQNQKMKDADMKARLKELYLPPAKDFVLVDVRNALHHDPERAPSTRST